MTDVVSFWARRRAAVKAEEEAELRAAEEAKADRHAAELAERDDDEVLAELGLPDPASLESGDDFSAFMARDVPEHLRHQALRTLWRSNPVLACVDGLNEYDDDYRAAMLLQEPIKTAYQVGKGMLKHLEEVERKAKAEPADVSDETDEVTDPAQEQASEEPAQDVEDKVAPVFAEADVSQSEESEALLPRRMRFRFEEAAV